jgi:hypothetical protein
MPSTMIGKPKFRATLYSPFMELMLDAVEMMIGEPHASFHEFGSITYLIVMSIDHLAELREAFSESGSNAEAQYILSFETQLESELKSAYD